MHNPMHNLLTASLIGFGRGMLTLNPYLFDFLVYFLIVSQTLIPPATAALATATAPRSLRSCSCKVSSSRLLLFLLLFFLTTKQFLSCFSQK